jgi:hypothetical protein
MFREMTLIAQLLLALTSCSPTADKQPQSSYQSSGQSGELTVVGPVQRGGGFWDGARTFPQNAAPKVQRRKDLPQDSDSASRLPRAQKPLPNLMEKQNEK